MVEHILTQSRYIALLTDVASHQINLRRKEVQKCLTLKNSEKEQKQLSTTDHISNDPFYNPENLAELRRRANDVRNGKVKPYKLLKDE